ncbi:LuxR C-terminal-related transcriptional regulator [Actinophytocola oryzae]|uniref:DNA-binding NarL/FixJ family response regulator n=1 Tax=Actinophytocola oryzae TaxID=502181 RepID=A0A4R7VF94_9PSEU|nr:LuxR C-terminal-related transcriptional regulator [Actinophytocola oryzae]TDV47892.1 DNA-binding NarL/FixJ family response regulator [Actinophytocola oryzae]
MATAPGQQNNLRVVIRSERRMFRDALTAWLRAQPEYAVVGHVGRLDDLVSLCRLRQPDVALVDVGSGHSGTDELRDCAALTTVVVVYESLSCADLGELCRVGVDTLLPCSHGLDALLVVLRRYLDGERDGPVRPAAGDGFTELERQIITLVGAGHTVHQIAQLLEASTSSVANTKRRIYRKLEVGSQGQAMARATALGIVARPAGRLLSSDPWRADVRDDVPGDMLPVVVRGTPGAAMQRTTTALLAGGLAVSSGVTLAGALVVLVDPAPSDWPEEGVPVVLVHSGQPSRAEILTALLRGVHAVMTADRVPADLVSACTLAVHGYVTIEAEAVRGVLEAIRAPSPDPGLPELTSRELDILRLIADGHTVRQTARALGIAAKTVENTQSRLYRKLGARNRSGALVAAHALGLLELREPVLGSWGGFAPQS